MTASTLETSSAAPARHRPPLSSRGHGRRITVVMLIVSLVVSGGLQYVVQEQANHFQSPGAAKARSTFGNMDTFALALLLGGLRGPLVMMLWSSSESQKSDHDLEDFDTKVEWIRRLQPEFDSVHMFQIWNKAYNISAMMASPANKFSVIMDALLYAENVDRERPGDLNILNSISNVYGVKLGSTNLPEFPFYSRQFREESMTDENRARAFPRDAAHFNKLDKRPPLLDASNAIRPELLEADANHPRPADLPANSEWNDGSELQYLKPYQYDPKTQKLIGFPYGVSQFAMAYNYAKRAQVAGSAEHQKSLQQAQMVIDSRPGVSMKFWVEDEMTRARAAEARALSGVDVPKSMDQQYAMQAPPSVKVADTSALAEAIYYYTMAARVADDALLEYERHLSNPDFVLRRNNYQWHELELSSEHSMSLGDAEYARAMQVANLFNANTGDQAALVAQYIAHLEAAVRQYTEARLRYERLSLETAIEDLALQRMSLKLRNGRTLPDRYAGRKGKPTDPPDRKLGLSLLRGDDAATIKQACGESIEDVYEDLYSNARVAATSLPTYEQSEADTRGEYQDFIDHCRVRMAFCEPQIKYDSLMKDIARLNQTLQSHSEDAATLSDIARLYGQALLGVGEVPFAPVQGSFVDGQCRLQSLAPENRGVLQADTGHALFVPLGDPMPLLDKNNQVVAEMVWPARQRPADLPADAAWNDGSPLQYLKPYAPFPYGLPPQALSYNYAKRAAVAQLQNSSAATQPADDRATVQSQPGLSLKSWADDEIRAAHTAEARAFDIAMDGEPDRVMASLSDISPSSKIADRAALDAAISHDDLAARLSAGALQEFKDHVVHGGPAAGTTIPAQPAATPASATAPSERMTSSTPPSDPTSQPASQPATAPAAAASPDPGPTTHPSSQASIPQDLYEVVSADLAAQQTWCQADHDYLAAIAANDPATRTGLFRSSTDLYARAATQLQRTVIEHLIEDPVLFSEFSTVLPSGFKSRGDLKNLSESDVNSVYTKALAAARRLPPKSRALLVGRVGHHLLVSHCFARIDLIRRELKK